MMSSIKTKPQLRTRIVFECGAWEPKRQNWVKMEAPNLNKAKESFLSEYGKGHPDMEIIEVSHVSAETMFGYEIVVDEREYARQIKILSYEYGEDFDESQFDLREAREEIGKGYLKGTGFLLEEDAREAGGKAISELAADLGYVSEYFGDADYVFWNCVQVKTYETFRGEKVEGTDFVGRS